MRTLNQARIKHAFSLIELLVVIAIIAILLSLLFPALGRAKLRVREGHCLGNMRKIAMGVGLYVGDHGQFPSKFVMAIP